MVHLGHRRMYHLGRYYSCSCMAICILLLLPIFFFLPGRECALFVATGRLLRADVRINNTHTHTHSLTHIIDFSYPIFGVVLQYQPLKKRLSRPLSAKSVSKHNHHHILLIFVYFKNELVFKVLLFFTFVNNVCTNKQRCLRIKKENWNKKLVRTTSNILLSWHSRNMRVVYSSPRKIDSAWLVGRFMGRGTQKVGTAKRRSALATTTMSRTTMSSSGDS